MASKEDTRLKVVALIEQAIYKCLDAQQRDGQINNADVVSVASYHADEIFKTIDADLAAGLAQALQNPGAEWIK